MKNNVSFEPDSGVGNERTQVDTLGRSNSCCEYRPIRGGQPNCAVTTPTLPAQSKLEMLTLRKILLPSGFSLLPDKVTREQKTKEATVESLATRVARHPFFAGMNRKQLRLVTDCAIAVEFRKGQVIFLEGDLADRFYLIESGNVILESSAGPSDPMLGRSWMFPPHTWTFTARAVEPTIAIFFYATLLRQYCEKDHSFGYELLKRVNLEMYQRMHAARNKLLTIRSRAVAHQPGRALTADAQMITASRSPNQTNHK